MGCDKIGETVNDARFIPCSPQTTQTALLPDSQALVRLSQHLVRSRPSSSIPFPGSPALQDLDILIASEGSSTLSSADRTALRSLKADLFRICERAKGRRVKVVVDAEQR
jgi:proline dehydrogenase